MMPLKLHNAQVSSSLLFLGLVSGSVTLIASIVGHDDIRSIAIGEVVDQGEVTADEIVVALHLVEVALVDILVPLVLAYLDFLGEALESSLLAVVGKVLKDLIELGEGPDNEADEEVLHDVRWVTLQRNAIGTNLDLPDAIDLHGLVILLNVDHLGLQLLLLIFFIECVVSTTLILIVTIIVVFLLGDDFVPKLAHAILTKHNVDEVVDFNIHGNSVDDVELNLALLELSRLGRDGTL